MTDQGDSSVGERSSTRNCAGQAVARVTFERCDFTEADLHGASTDGCRFIRCDFSRADLADAKHTATAFQTCTFDRTLLTGWSLMAAACSARVPGLPAAAAGPSGTPT